jgi:hypothetical protein
LKARGRSDLRDAARSMVDDLMKWLLEFVARWC